MVCENCGVRPASVQVFGQQQGGQRVTSYLCTQCARQLGMIGGGGNFGGTSPFEMLQNLVQQQGGQGPGNFFEALSGEARESVMRAREASAGTTRTNAIGTDHLLAGIVTGNKVATEAPGRAGATGGGWRAGVGPGTTVAAGAPGRAGANVDEMRSTFAEQRGDPGEAVYTFTPSAKHAPQPALQAARTPGAAQRAGGPPPSAQRARARAEAGSPGPPSPNPALQLAFQAARQMGAAQIGSEHLLLGL